jgi:hypothetical protein
MERFLGALTNAISGQKKTHPKDLGGGVAVGWIANLEPPQIDTSSVPHRRMRSSNRFNGDNWVHAMRLHATGMFVKLRGFRVLP